MEGLEDQERDQWERDAMQIDQGLPQGESTSEDPHYLLVD